LWPAPALASVIGHARLVAQPFPCMGHEGLPQQDLAEPGPEAFRVTVALPSTAAQTGDSMKIPGTSEARTRRAKAKARIERMRPSSYTMGP